MKKYGSLWEVLCGLLTLFSYLACPYGAYSIVTSVFGTGPIVKIIATICACLTGMVFFYLSSRTEDASRDAERAERNCTVAEHKEVQAVNDLAVALDLLTPEQREIYNQTKRTVVFDLDDL